MPYTIRKQKCTQSDGDKGTYVLSYTTKKGKKVRNCHTSKKKAQGQIAAIEGPPMNSGDEPSDKAGLEPLDELKVGRHVVAPDGTEGFIVSFTINEGTSKCATCNYCCTNSGPGWSEGDVITKPMHQIKPLGVLTHRLQEGSVKPSSDLMYHHRRNIPINENVFRPGSWRYFALIREARKLVKTGVYRPRKVELRILDGTDVGKFGVHEGYVVPLDFPMPAEDYATTSITEAEYKGRDVDLNKPMRGDKKKYKVYVKNEKGNVIEVEFGDSKGGLTQKIQDMDRRRAFGDRHNCDKKDDKTKPGYWSCRLPRYWKELGFKKPPNPSGEWW